MTYIDAETVTSEDDLAEAVLAYIADQITGWEPAEGDPETSMAEAVALVASAIATIIREEGRDAFSGFGTRILNAPRGGDEVAQALTRWTLDTNPAGRVIPDGSEIVIDTADGVPVGFAVIGDQAVATGMLVAENIPVAALETGADKNGVAGVVRDFEPLTFITDVEITTPATGGADEEGIEEYLDRIQRLARRVRALPVTSDDYADAALDERFVDRALAVNLLDLENPPPGAEPWLTAPEATGHVTVFPLNAGEQLTAPQKAALLASLVPVPDNRLLNTTVHIGEPTITPIDVDISVRVDPNIIGTEQVIDLVESAIADRLSPENHLRDADEPGEWRPPLSIADRRIYDYDVAHAADAQDGILGVTDVTLNGGRVVLLPGWAPLPVLQTIVVNVLAPGDPGDPDVGDGDEELVLL